MNGAGALAGSRRLVVKIGSALLVEPDTGRLRADWLAGVAQDIAGLHQQGKDVIVVSSGAIGLGCSGLGFTRTALRLDENQAAAAVGQIRLAHAWHSALRKYDIPVAQILLTLGDTEQRERYLNAERTLATLLRQRVVPVVNENDTVATEEIRYGDNDRLAARVAQMVAADCLVLLSDVDGLYRTDPGLDPDATFVATVSHIDAGVEAMAGDSLSGMGSGGMKTKLAAARIAVAAGCGVALAGGRRERPLAALATGTRHTWFEPKGTPASARKRWIAGSLHARGSLVVDSGAAVALRSGKSLLAAGVTAVAGEFGRGDPVRVVTEQGEQIGLGLCAYDSAESGRLCGCRSQDIEGVLGYRGRAEMIHRDDLVVSG